MSNTDAPIVFFDKVHAYGIAKETVCVELATSAFSVKKNGTVDVSDLIVAHLRCSPSAARHLIRSLEKALEIAEAPHTPTNQMTKN